MSNFDTRQADGARNTSGNRCSIVRSWARAFDIAEKVISTYLSGILIVSLVAAMCVEILLRFTLNKSLLGLPEVVEVAVMVLTFTALAMVQRDDGHIKMAGIITWLMKRRAGQVVKFLTMLAVVTLFVLISWVLVDYTVEAYRVKHTTWNIYMPLWPAYIIVTLASIITLLRLVVQMKNLLLEILKDPKRQGGNFE
jgi:TRAP-type C4-dicarboxylate transport system permease small subunit